MVAGLIFTAGYIIYFKFMAPELNVPANWLFGISPEGIGSIGMLINFVLTWTVSRVTTAPPEHIQHLVENIRVPRGAGSAVDRKSVVSGKSVSVRVDLGGRRIIKKKKTEQNRNVSQNSKSK